MGFFLKSVQNVELGDTEVTSFALGFVLAGLSEFCPLSETTNPTRLRFESFSSLTKKEES